MTIQAEGAPRRTATLIYVAAAVVFACLLTFASTRKYGLGITPDSVSYIAASESLRTSGVLSDYDGRPFSAWPPGYPVLLATLGIGHQSGRARYLQLGLVGVLVTLCAALLFRVSSSTRLFALGLFAVVVATPLVTVSSFLWSEIPYVVVVTASAVVLDARRPLAAVACVSVACLFRYGGLALLPALAIALTAHGHRLRFAIAAIVAASTPIMIWVCRNVLQAGFPFGSAPQEPARSFGRMMQLADAVGDWLIPSLVPEPSASAGDWLALTMLLAVLVAATFQQRRPGVLYLALSAVFYLAMLTVTAAVRNTDAIDQRLLAPVVIPAIVCFVDGLRRLELGSHRRRTLAPCLAVLWSIALLAQMFGVFAAARVRAATGAGGLSRNDWQASPFLEDVRTYPLGAFPASNKAYAVYWLTRQFTRPLENTGSMCPDDAGERRQFVLFAVHPEANIPAGWSVEHAFKAAGGTIVSAVRECR